MPLSAWVMLGIGCLLCYGGLAVSIIIAVKSKKHYTND